MTEILKNMFRRKTRTLLTIFGITIGIFAFTVMGSMAEKISLLVNGGTKYYSDKVTVSQSESLFISAPMHIGKAKEIEKVDGVAAVTPTVFTSLTEKFDAVSFGPPASIASADVAVSDTYESFEITYSSGRELQAGETGKITVGADLVKKLGAKVGQSVKIRNKDFEVVGIMNKTLTAPDNEVFMALPDAQQIYYSELPEIIRNQSKPEEIVNGFTVYVDPDVDPNQLAEKINQQVGDIKASGPKAFQDQIATATGVFNAILFGIALISLIVGGLSIINTMTMSVSERVREIGIKKAVGAKTRNILGEYLGEAGLIGLFGGFIGWGLGAILVLILNKIMEDSGNVIFLLTWRISIFAIVFSVVLGILAGFYPAYHAVRLNIVRALREE